jgi:hypothetical protein
MDEIPNVDDPIGPYGQSSWNFHPYPFASTHGTERHSMPYSSGRYSYVPNELLQSPQDMRSYRNNEIENSYGPSRPSPWNHLHLASTCSPEQHPVIADDIPDVLQDEWFSDQALEESNIGLGQLSQLGPRQGVSYEPSGDEGQSEVQHGDHVICDRCPREFPGAYRAGHLQRPNRPRHAPCCRHYLNFSYHLLEGERPPAVPQDLRLAEEGAGLYSLASNIKAQYSEVI